jgi:hypothetical protein
MNTAESQLMCATVEYVNGQVRVHLIYKSMLAELLEELNPVDG